MRQYDPLKVVGSFAWAGGSVDILDGTVNEGDFATVEDDNPRWSRETDRNGRSTRVKNNNRGGVVPVTLSASSPTNAALRVLANTDDLTENIVGTLTLNDLNGTTIVVGTGAFIETNVKPTFGAARGSLVWRFQCERIDAFGGGHNVV